MNEAREKRIRKEIKMEENIENLGSKEGQRQRNREVGDEDKERLGKRKRE